jgi:hypothetical protein
MRAKNLKLGQVGAMMGAVLFGGAIAHANTELYTTMDDFSQWSNSGSVTTTGVTTPDSDGSSINGLGNTTAAGGTGTPGSLQVAASSGTYDFFYGPGEQGNAPFLAALGSSGTINVDFQYPTNNGGNYFSLGLVLNYTSNFGQFSAGTPVSDGNGWYTESIPYTVNTAASYSYFQLGLIFNSNYDTSAPAVFNVDNINIQSVPEPATLGSLGAGLTLLTLRRRRRGSV